MTDEVTLEQRVEKLETELAEHLRATGVVRFVVWASATLAVLATLLTVISLTDVF